MSLPLLQSHIILIPLAQAWHGLYKHDSRRDDCRRRTQYHNRTDWYSESLYRFIWRAWLLLPVGRQWWRYECKLAVASWKFNFVHWLMAFIFHYLLEVMLLVLILKVMLAQFQMSLYLPNSRISITWAGSRVAQPRIPKKWLYFTRVSVFYTHVMRWKESVKNCVPSLLFDYWATDFRF